MLKLRLPIPRILSAGEVCTGAGSLGALRALGAAKAAVLVSGSVAGDIPVLKKITAAIGAIDLLVLEKAPGEPTRESLVAPLAKLVAFAPDWLIAVGGGSVIDTMKLLWALYEHPEIEDERLTRPFALPPLRGKARFVAVPTTAGSGSEVSSSAIFLDTPNGRKVAVVSHDFLPDIVILDPALLDSLSPLNWAASGLDALAHALEGYVSRFENPFADLQAEAAARTIFETLPAVVTDPGNREQRLELQMAAMMAGWVQNLKVPGIGHALAHQLGALGISHGIACALLLPHAMTMNIEYPASAAKYQRLALRLGLKSAPDLISAVSRLIETLGLDPRLSSYAHGGSETLFEKMDSLAHQAAEDLCARANPRPVTDSLARELLERAG